MQQNDLSRVKRNIGKMIDQSAPEADIDAYLQEEGVTAEQLRAYKAPTAAPPKQAPPPQGGLAAPAPNMAPAPTGGDFAPPTNGSEIDRLQLDPTQEQAVYDFLGSSTDRSPEALQAFAAQFGASPLADPQAVLNAFGEGVRPTNPAPAAGADPEVKVSASNGYPSLSEIGKYLYAGAGDLVESAGDTVGLITNPLNAGINWALGSNVLGTDLGGAARELTGAPEGNRYAKAINTAGGSVLTGAGLAGLVKSGAKTAPTLIANAFKEEPVRQTIAAAGGGVTAQAAEDIGLPAPVQMGLGILASGGVYAASKGGAPIKEWRDNKWVDKQVEGNPYAAYDAEIVEDLKNVAATSAKTKLDPKGRANLTIKEVNNLEQQYQARFKDMINGLDLPPSEKLRLKAALDGDYSASVDAANTLRGTPQGDAIADAIIKTQRLRALTPEASATGIGPKLKMLAEGAAAVGGTATTGSPLVGGGAYGAVKYALSRFGNTEAARVNSADRLIKQSGRYSKLGERVGPSGQRESQQNLTDLYNQTADGAYEATKAKKLTKEEIAAEKVAKEQMAAAVRNPFPDANDLQYGDLASRAKTKKSAAEKVISKSNAGLSTFDELLAIPKAKAAAKEKVTPREQAAIEKNIADGVQGTSKTQEAFATRLGVPKADMLRALEKIKGDVPDFADDINRIANNYPTTKQRGIADVLVPRMKQVLEADGTMARIQADAKVAAERAAAKRKLANPNEATVKGGDGTTPAPKIDQAVYDRLADVTDGQKGIFVGGDPEQGDSSTFFTAFDAPEGAPSIEVVEIVSPDGKTSKYVTPDELQQLQESNVTAVGRQDQYEQGKANFQAQADEYIERYFANESISDQSYKLVGDAPKVIRNNYRTTQEAKEYIDDVVLPDLEIAGVKPAEIAAVREELLNIASAKRHNTKADYDEAMYKNKK
jgi:hypothetical protein